jgi:multisubunit Na+/H+ antiporter MnhB subunit
MIGRAVSVLRRASRRTRWLMLAAVGLVVLLIVASALAPAPRRPHRSMSPVPRSTRTHQAPHGPASAAGVSVTGLADARRVARRFFAGYLPFLYGRRSAQPIHGMTRALRAQPTRTLLVTPVERRRHPRLVSLTGVGRAVRVVLATALVADGGITTYALRITVREGRTGWLVSSVDRG